MDGHYATVVIQSYDGKFLVGYHPANKQKWRFFGGKLEEGEPALAAAAREMVEELSARPLSLEFIVTTRPQIFDGVTWVGHHFLLKAAVGELEIPEKESQKITRMHWMTVAELLQNDVHPEYEVAKMVLAKEGKF